ncbi:tRNA (adenosine(37)-N6)-threonylcarbamoyltransferase complex dimerization subunit type 1 TsaB [Acetohalobium arabaticum]|uniref:Peptidase M22 glycoprotease n=1 Tax=Acetohalobium arabaticum (strain ATCC 49924 / DSM 5501 / Z-7288) TaxID=574087 RepID=D9QT80_ACEAZ|nr:tRNA (adenosine(37)-N6)-threonylcarbamoyltransferase complex dimerization subunit type 1 TsaB [Acetohalobium arabaticum]ADL13580.1 peptidase M22 glycoprotease [Acetohalobium arabaticum DSM 5501]
MLILAVDSSTSVGAVCLYKEEVIAEYNLNLDKTHSQRLMDQIVGIIDDAYLECSALEAIAVGVGPGSFTGIRIGLATAKSLAHALDIPVVGISTLEALANNLLHITEPICPMLDARRQRVYTAVYQEKDGLGLKEPVVAEDIKEVDSFLEELSKRFKQKIFFIGPGAEEYRELIEDRLGTQAEFSLENNLVQGKSLAQIGSIKLKTGGGDKLMDLKPNYLKRSQAERDWQVSKGDF